MASSLESVKNAKGNEMPKGELLKAAAKTALKDAGIDYPEGTRFFVDGRVMEGASDTLSRAVIALLKTPEELDELIAVTKDARNHEILIAVRNFRNNRLAQQAA